MLGNNRIWLQELVIKRNNGEGDAAKRDQDAD